MKRVDAFPLGTNRVMTCVIWNNSKRDNFIVQVVLDSGYWSFYGWAFRKGRPQIHTEWLVYEHDPDWLGAMAEEWIGKNAVS
jgi:hypothetical protein